jgi:hypothetical protein
MQGYVQGKWTLIDESGESLVLCFLVDINIKEP